MPDVLACETGVFLDASHRIARRLLDGADWYGDACTWHVLTGDESRVFMGPAQAVKAGGTLYQGTAGIALFLAELYRVTGDRTLLACLRGAMRHAVQDNSQRQLPCSLYSGAVGVAYVSSRLFAALGDDEWVSVVREVPARVTAIIARDAAYDIIAGGAGAIVGLLRLSRELIGDDGLNAALVVGAHLEMRATKHPYGWSWGTFGSSRQDLCGYSHGASGIAHAFLELFAATGDGRWRHAAARAMQYERHHREPTRGGEWPDYRDIALMHRLYPSSAVARLRADLRSGTRVLRSNVAYAQSWCHGSPGIALTRLRAMSLGVDRVANEIDARDAIELTAQTLPAMKSRGQSLCHGGLGNAESLLQAERMAGWEFGDLARQSALEGIEQFERAGVPWPSGNMGKAPDPTLMMGDAGIGLFLLQLADASVPSALFLSDWSECLHDQSASDTERDGLQRRRNDAVEFLAMYESVSARFSGAGAVQVETIVKEGADLPIEVLSAIEQTCRSLPDDDAGAKLVDAIKPEAALIRAHVCFKDYAQQRLDEIRVLAPDEIDWPTVHVQRAPSAKLVRTEWAWREWMSAASGATLEQAEEAYIVYRSGKDVRLAPLSTLDAFVLNLLDTPLTASELAARIAVEADIAPHAQSAINANVQLCLEEGVRTGFLWATP